MNIIKILWIIDAIFILFFRYTPTQKIMILVFTIILTIITVIRQLNSRDEWREIAEKYHEELDNDK